MPSSERNVVMTEGHPRMSAPTQGELEAPSLIEIAAASSPSLDRRALLQLALAALPLSLAGCEGESERQRRRLVDTRRDLPSAKVVGRLWLRAQAEPPSTAALVESLALRLKSFPAENEGLIQALRTQHKADLAAGRFTSAGGWVLSETEALLYALAARA
ncbi:MAG: hypothetical protein VYD19_02000 [Myxococcota bacterium]|nr:hypothetical protein [Myxococcota bacterium]